MIEHRAARLEIRGRTISGLALPWGARARIAPGRYETFTAGSFADLKPVPLRREHGGPTIGQVTPSSSSRGLEVRGSYEGDLGGRSRFSVEFRAQGETDSGSLRIVHDASLHGLAAVRSPAYSGAVIEHRQGAALTLVEGPVGSNKSEVLRRLLADGDADVVADLTPLWAALRLIERDGDGKYPERLADDPALLLALYTKGVIVRQALQRGLKAAVTTATPDQAAKWQAVADEVGVELERVTLNPARDVIEARLLDASGKLSAECSRAVERWYGSRREARTVPESGRKKGIRGRVARRTRSESILERSGGGVPKRGRRRVWL